MKRAAMEYMHTRNHLIRSGVMTPAIIPTLHLTQVYGMLLAAYGEPQNEPDDDALGGLIGTIL